MISYYLIAVIIVVVDQITKYLTVNNIALGETIPFIPDVLSITYVQNTGAAWSILEGQFLFFYIVTFIVIGILIYLLHNDAKDSKLLSVAIAFMLGGAVGNFIDRLFLQYVVDMIRLEFINFPIFNIADMALTIGVVLMIIAVVYEEFFVEKAGEEDESPQV